MAYDKKTWVNVPDPDGYTGDIPLSDLPRFDADNMNRLEQGIKDAHNALHENIVVGTRSNHSSDGGVRFGIMYTEDGVPMVGMGTQRGSNSLIITSGCDYTNLTKETELGQRGYYFPVKLDESNTSYPVAIKVSNQDGKVYVVRSSNGRKYYAKNEIIPMSEYEVLHTGNAPTLVQNAIDILPVSKGGTGGNAPIYAANNLMVKSLAGGTAINENDDLNSYVTVGNYYCNLSATSKTLSNCPVDSAFVMTVGRANGTISYLYQEITHFSTGVKYYRYYTTTSEEWSDWRVTYNTLNKPVVSGIYTGDKNASKFIDIGFTPAWVFVMPRATISNWSSQFYGQIGLATSKDSGAFSGGYSSIRIVENGFYVYYGGTDTTNWRATNADVVFSYIAGK